MKIFYGALGKFLLLLAVIIATVSQSIAATNQPIAKKLIGKWEGYVEQRKRCQEPFPLCSLRLAISVQAWVEHCEAQQA